MSKGFSGQITPQSKNQKKYKKNNASVYINGEAIANSASNQSNNTLTQFSVVKSLNINLSYSEQYDVFLTQVIKLGSAQFYTYSTSSISTREYTQKALDEAITDAKNKASYIARQTGVALGEMISFKEITLPAVKSNQMPVDGQEQSFKYIGENSGVINREATIPAIFRSKVHIKYALRRVN